jgi:2-polyprenyl-6-methoxyphenol hydroxylase-like FAD-dependent oxidoreductase
VAASVAWLRPLPRQCIQVTFFECNLELREFGAGLTLWANGVQVLRHLGFDDPLTVVSARLTSFERWSWRGKRLDGIRLGSIERRVGAPSVGIHHADLCIAGAKNLTLCSLRNTLAADQCHIFNQSTGLGNETLE